MIRIILIVILTIIPNFAFSQKTLFDSLKVDKTTKIIGRSPHYDKSKTYENYNFIIEDSTKIIDFLNNLTLGEEVSNSMENPNFLLSLVKNNKEIGSWIISPKLNKVMTGDGHTYTFNFQQISDLNKSFPLKYRYEVKVFNTKVEYENYINVQKQNSKFLFDFSPQFKYEGRFEIEFKKSSKFSSPKAISEFLSPYIEKIVPKGEYTLSYVLNKKNLNNRNQFTMTICGPKKLFDELKVNELKNKNWTPIIEKGYFFYLE